MGSPELLTARQVAVLLGIAVRTVHQRIALGTLTPIVKLPGKTGAYLFDRDHIDLVAESAVRRSQRLGGGRGVSQGDVAPVDGGQ